MKNVCTQRFANGNAEFTRALGLELDASAAGMGLRSQRYAMTVEDGVVRSLDIDPPRTFEHSSAEAVLTRL
jgi:peroxiredoxin